LARGRKNATLGFHRLTRPAGRKLTIRPAIVPDQPIVPIAWLCHGANVPKGMVVHGQDRSDLSSDMLPIECRPGPEAKK
jgi:type IV pilus assembly protein PilA